MSNDRNKTLDWKATKILELIHSDLAGPIQPLAKDDYQYLINFINDYSGLIFLKTQVWHFTRHNKISSWHHLLRPCKMFTDRQWNRVYFGTISTVTYTSYSLHQNGTAERSWQTLFSIARYLLIESQYRNKRKTPHERFTGSKPNLSKMHIFSMTCFYYVQNKMKLDPHCEKGIFVGYDKQSPAYLIYFSESMAIKRLRCFKIHRFLW